MAYWMGGIAVLYTRFEKLEISSAYATWNATSNKTDKGLGEWKVTINLKNTGSADAIITIKGLLVNRKPWNDEYFSGNISDPSLPVSVPSGQQTAITFYIQQTAITFYITKGGGFNSGVNIEIKLYSAFGQEYVKTITLD